MLDDRKSAILRAVVQQYIETAQPVGSQHVVESSSVGVSAATVRNEMTLLEREGYLVQPHTSAGRIPTEKGYRFFVDGLGGPGELGPAQVRQVRAFFSHAHGELEQMLRDTSRLLSELTTTTAVVVGEPSQSATIRSAQLVGLSARTYLVVLVLSTGSIIKRSVDHATDLTDEQLAAASAHLAGHLDGRPIGPAGPIPPPSPSGDPVVDAVLADAVGAITETLDREGTKVYVDGAGHIAGAFEAADTLREILLMLEEQLTVVTLVRHVIDSGLTVAIGSETGVAPLSDCSIVVAPFAVGDEHAGTIGLLGPTRMNYPETLAAVAMVSQRLTTLLTEG